MAESFSRSSHTWAHRSDLVLYARKVLGDQADSAEDIVQEAYLRLLALAANDDAPASARPWLFRVVRNLAVDERRSASRRAVPTAELDLVFAVHTDDPAAIAERNHELAGALAEVAALPDRERRALEMDQAGIGAQRIATQLETTPNAVHQALFRARRRLRNARAVAWGLVPVGAVPLALRMSDPAVAVSVANLPPGMPVGRALPVAALCTAGLVGGTFVAPSLDPTPAKPVPSILQAVPAAAPASNGTSGRALPAGPESAAAATSSRRTVSDDASSSDGDAHDGTKLRETSDDDEDRSGSGKDDGDRSGSGKDDDDDRSGSGKDDDRDRADDDGDDRSGSGDDDDARRGSSGSSSNDSDDDDGARRSSSSSGKRSTAAKAPKKAAKKTRRATKKAARPATTRRDDGDDDDDRRPPDRDRTRDRSGSGDKDHDAEFDSD
jgi:RNA polymerase sigma-70 factor (ECF subfamily)